MEQNYPSVDRRLEFELGYNNCKKAVSLSIFPGSCSHAYPINDTQETVSFIVSHFALRISAERTLPT